MAVDNPYGVKAVSEKDAAMMRAYTPACVALIDGCQDVPEVCMRACATDKMVCVL